MKTSFVFILLALLFIVGSTSAQKKTTPMIKVCGDPAAACSKRAMFDDDDLPFTYTTGTPVAESAPFYVVIVKSVKLTEDQPCEKVPEGFREEHFNTISQITKYL